MLHWRALSGYQRTKTVKRGKTHCVSVIFTGLFLLQPFRDVLPSLSQSHLEGSLSLFPIEFARVCVFFFTLPLQRAVRSE